MRAISALDIALWDLAGKAAGLPIYQLLGGASRESIRIYNTCYDRVDFLTEPVRMARRAARERGRRNEDLALRLRSPAKREAITSPPRRLEKGIDPIRRIRDKFGDAIDVAIEFHGFWNLPSAQKSRTRSSPTVRCGLRRCCLRIISRPTRN